MFQTYGLLALPVVDHENRLVGIITVDDAMEVMEEDAEEDFEVMGALRPSEAPLPEDKCPLLAKTALPGCLS